MPEYQEHPEQIGQEKAKEFSQRLTALDKVNFFARRISDVMPISNEERGHLEELSGLVSGELKDFYYRKVMAMFQTLELSELNQEKVQQINSEIEALEWIANNQEIHPLPAMKIAKADLDDDLNKLIAFDLRDSIEKLDWLTEADENTIRELFKQSKDIKQNLDNVDINQLLELVSRIKNLSIPAETQNSNTGLNLLGLLQELKANAGAYVYLREAYRAEEHLQMGKVETEKVIEDPFAKLSFEGLSKNQIFELIRSTFAEEARKIEVEYSDKRSALDQKSLQKREGLSIYSEERRRLYRKQRFDEQKLFEQKRKKLQALVELKSKVSKEHQIYI